MTPLENISKEFGVKIAAHVDSLTRKPGQNYFDFITSVCNYDLVAVIVKLADLEHNMSDLGEGSLKDKYRIAEDYLRNQLNY